MGQSITRTVGNRKKYTTSTRKNKKGIEPYMWEEKGQRQGEKDHACYPAKEVQFGDRNRGEIARNQKITGEGREEAVLE